MLLDIVEVAQSHTGENLAAAFAKIMEDYEISEKEDINYNIYIYNWTTHQILGITCDNASNNDTMIENLATIMSHFSGEANRARCLAHIVNLVAKIILRQFEVSKNRKKKKNLPKEVNNDDNDKIVDTEVVVDKVEVEKVIVDEEAEETDDFEDERDRVLDKEEKEMDGGGDDEDDDEDSQKLLQDVDILEEQMRDEIDRVGMKVKPVRQALFKVTTSSLLYSFFLPIFPLTILSLTSFF